MINWEEIGEKIKKKRELLNLTKEDLASKTNSSISSIYRIEKGQIPNADVIVKIAEILDLSLDSLFGFEKSKDIPNYLQERISKLDSIESENLPDKLEEIAKELLEVSKKLKSL